MFKDKLFLLSDSEVHKYLPTDESRRCKYRGEYDWWWLRSPGGYTYITAYVSYNGYLYRYGLNVCDSNHAVRPALHLNPAHLKSLEHTEKDCVLFAGREWLVLDEKCGLLLSKEAVARHRFDKNHNDYQESEIRAYLNGELFNELFNAEEKDLIMDTIVIVDDEYTANENTTPEQETKKLLETLTPEQEDAIYRSIWVKHVKKDIQSYAEENIEGSLTDDQIDYAAGCYVYDGEYDCNLPYWANINNVIKMAQEFC